MTFHVGQKVTRVNKNEAWIDLATGEKRGGPDWGEVCTVTRCFYVSLIEAIELAGWPIPFVACNFRPVVERKTDISIFQRMLTDKKVRVECVASVRSSLNEHARRRGVEPMETANIVVSLSLNDGQNTITISPPGSEVNLLWRIAAASANLATVLSREKRMAHELSKLKPSKENAPT